MLSVCRMVDTFVLPNELDGGNGSWLLYGLLCLYVIARDFPDGERTRIC